MMAVSKLTTETQRHRGIGVSSALPQKDFIPLSFIGWSDDQPGTAMKGLEALESLCLCVSVVPVHYCMEQREGHGS